MSLLPYVYIFVTLRREIFHLDGVIYVYIDYRGREHKLQVKKCWKIYDETKFLGS